jgi:hypothetical protein
MLGGNLLTGVDLSRVQLRSFLGIIHSLVAQASTIYSGT